MSNVMARAAAFLLLQDSKASYAIEGEQPPLNRLQRWGSVVGQAGKKPLNEVELVRLQAIVLDNTRFTKWVGVPKKVLWENTIDGTELPYLTTFRPSGRRWDS